MHNNKDATLSEDSLMTDKNKTHRQMPNRSWKSQAYEAFWTHNHQTAMVTPQMPEIRSNRATSPIFGKSTVYLEERHFFSNGRRGRGRRHRVHEHDNHM